MGVANTLGTVIAGAGSSAITLSAYDGSRWGPAEAPIKLVVRSPRALSYLVQSPGELGLGRAYVAGDLDVEGDMYDALATMSTASLDHLSWKDRLAVARALGVDALRPVARPEHEVRPHGWWHSRQRDRSVISHHYDVSNRFYELVLGPSMAYTCAVYPTRDATLEQAQEGKFDLVARKLGLRPGMRLLDVGCGWGGMVLHAAREYGVRALGVTLSHQQAEWAQKAIADAGLAELAEVRWQDYRDAPAEEFDAVSSIGLTEHIGRAQLPSYVRALESRLRPGGRLLNHCITRPTTQDPSIRRRGFINRYVFPDGELLGVGTIVSAIQDNGFEVRHEENLREHYAMTLRDWGRNLEDNWEEAVAEVGVGKARVWRLYMAGCRLAFDRRGIELHQVLAGKTDRGVSGFPLRPDWGV